MSGLPFVYAEDEDPFAPLDDAIGQPEQRPATWTIERGNANDPDTSPEAQGRRAAKCAERVRRARDVQKMQFAMIDAEIEALEAQIAEAKHRREQVDRWFLDRTEFERYQLRYWYDTSDLFTDSRQKSFPLSHGLTLGSRAVPDRTKWDAPVEVLLEALPDQCFEYQTKLRKAEANKLVEVVGGQVILKATGETIEGATVETTPGHTEVYLTEGAGHEKIALVSAFDAMREVTDGDEE
jgi:hypothetical protein